MTLPEATVSLFPDCNGTQTNTGINKRCLGFLLRLAHDVRDRNEIARGDDDDNRRVAECLPVVNNELEFVLPGIIGNKGGDCRVRTVEACRAVIRFCEQRPSESERIVFCIG